MSLSIEEAAQKMGMKPHREVTAVTAVDGGDVVTTHDGSHTFIADDGSMEFNVPAPAQAHVIVDVVGDEDLDDDEDDPEAVPEGSTDAVLAWVGDDPERAARALAAERDRDKPRSTLVAALEKLG
jgi:hypothetical protein